MLHRRSWRTRVRRAGGDDWAIFEEADGSGLGATVLATRHCVSADSERGSCTRLVGLTRSAHGDWWTSSRACLRTPGFNQSVPSSELGGGG